MALSCGMMAKRAPYQREIRAHFAPSYGQDTMQNGRKAEGGCEASEVSANRKMPQEEGRDHRPMAKCCTDKR